MQGFQVQAVLSCIIVVVVSVSARCPQGAIDRVQQCTATVLPNLSPKPHGPHAYTNHVQVARETCRDARLREAADCIQGILDQCRGTTEQEQTLQRLIDKERLLDTVDYFCRHFRVYERNAKCIARHHEEVAVCSNEAQQSFLTKINAGATMDVLIMGSCRFHSAARTCLTNTTKVHCGEIAGEFVYTLLTGLMPPYCEEENPEYRPIQPNTPTRRWDMDYHNDDSSAGLVTGNVILCLLVLWLGYLLSRLGV